MNHLPFTRDLVLVGGGHSHALVLRMWGMDPLPGARLTVIDPGPTVAYSGMLPGFVAGHYSRDDLEIDLVCLSRFAGARLITGPAVGLDPAARLVHVPGRPPVAYDAASIDIGITSAMPQLPGFATHGVPAKPLGPFATRWAAYLAGTGPARVAVIGGGVAGAELIMAMAHALRRAGRAAKLHLIDRSVALSDVTHAGRGIIRRRLAGLGVTVIEHSDVVRVTEDAVILAPGQTVGADFITGAAGAHPHPWLADTGLALQDGFVSVNGALQTSDPAVFAAGDCAHMAENPRPKAGVYAVRQAPVLLHNLRAALSEAPMRPYRPQRDYLKLVSLGGRAALAQRFGLAVAGTWLWRWKDRIDRRFMRRLNDLPAMAAAALPVPRAAGLDAQPQPMCGGCGAKLGRGALRAALDDLPAPRNDISPLPGDDAALLYTGDARQVITTDHLRALTDDPVQMTRIAAVHALGDIWAMGAAPQAALISLTLPRLSPALQRRTLAEIMQTAADVLGAEGAQIVGGHSAMGAEMTIGFTLTGLLDRAPVTLAGARPGDALILTRPIGTGTVLAGAMAGRAHGADVAGCLAQMARPQGDAAALLRGAHAMTDVTGFGLAGHLAGLCAASGVAAQLDLDAVPILPGAQALAEAGIRSTLWDDNRADAGAVDAADGPVGDLIFDPQTAGGLLAAVPVAAADRLCVALAQTGHQAARIGRVLAGAPRITCR